MRNRRASRRFPDNTGTMYLARASQVALWTHELTGQISDGMWENAGPWEHYRFWCRLNACLLPAGAGEARVETDHGYLCDRDAYGFSSLYFLDEETGTRPIQDRMVRLGRMGLACELASHTCGYEQRVASDDMPETYDGYMDLHENVAGMPDDPRVRFIAAVPMALAQVYYRVAACKAYDVRQMKADVKAIKAAMKNRVRVPEGQPTA